MKGWRLPLIATLLTLGSTVSEAQFVVIDPANLVQNILTCSAIADPDRESDRDAAEPSADAD